MVDFGTTAALVKSSTPAVRGAPPIHEIRPDDEKPTISRFFLGFALHAAIAPS
jgi:hypothetical protein